MWCTIPSTPGACFRLSIDSGLGAIPVVLLASVEMRVSRTASVVGFSEDLRGCRKSPRMQPERVGDCGKGCGLSIRLRPHGKAALIIPHRPADVLLFQCRAGIA